MIERLSLSKKVVFTFDHGWSSHKYLIKVPPLIPNFMGMTVFSTQVIKYLKTRLIETPSILIMLDVDYRVKCAMVYFIISTKINKHWKKINDYPESLPAF